MSRRRKSTFDVYTKRCDECLFSDAKIVSDDRKTEILAECRKEDRNFSCHKATMTGDDVCCRGFYDAPEYRGVGLGRRLATALGLIRVVPLPILDSPTPRTTRKGRR